MIGFLPHAGVLAEYDNSMIATVNPEQLSLTKECAEAFFAESQLPGKLDFEHWMKAWTGLITQGIGRIYTFSAYNEIKGILGGMFFPCTMTGELEALEGFWFVKKEARGGVGAIKMLKAFENDAKEKGCKRIKMVHLLINRPEEVSNIYLRMGYSPLQTAYSKEL